MSVHIYSAAWQPATKFIDNNIDPPMTFSFAPNSMMWCDKCRKRRRAKNLVVQCFYDGVRKQCAEGKGCRR